MGAISKKWLNNYHWVTAVICLLGRFIFFWKTAWNFLCYRVPKRAGSVTLICPFSWVKDANGLLLIKWSVCAF